MLLAVGSLTWGRPCARRHWASLIPAAIRLGGGGGLSCGRSPATAISRPQACRIPLIRSAAWAGSLLWSVLPAGGVGPPLPVFLPSLAAFPARAAGPPSAYRCRLRVSVKTWPSAVSTGSWYAGTPCSRMHWAAACSAAARLPVAVGWALAEARLGTWGPFEEPEQAVRMDAASRAPPAATDRCAVMKASREEWSAVSPIAGARRQQQVYSHRHDTFATSGVGPMSSGDGHHGTMRVLVVEDHVALAGRIAEGLRDAGMAV